MKAEEANTIATKTIEETNVDKILSEIKAAAEKGEFHIVVYGRNYNSLQKAKLETLGYSCSEDYSKLTVSWSHT